MMSGDWYKVPSELFNCPYMSKADIMVWAYVADRVKWEERAVSVPSIMQATELSRRTVQQSLRKLCEYGFLQATERAGRCTVYKQTLIRWKAQESIEMRRQAQ